MKVTITHGERRTSDKIRVSNKAGSVVLMPSSSVEMTIPDDGKPIELKFEKVVEAAEKPPAA
jgi:hypothetical protein